MIGGILKEAMGHELEKKTANMLIWVGWYLKLLEVFIFCQVYLFEKSFINDFLSFFLFFGFTHSIRT